MLGPLEQAQQREARARVGLNAARAELAAAIADRRALELALSISARLVGRPALARLQEMADAGGWESGR